MTRLTRGVVGAALLAGLGGCATPPSEPEPERLGPSADEQRAFVDARCQSVSACACAGEVVEAGCEPMLTDRWDARRATAEDLGLEYDAACWQALAEQVRARECFWPGGTTPLCDEFCAVFHGDRTLGESCSRFDEQSSDCAQGLLCAEGSADRSSTCVEPCDALGGRPLGATCATPERDDFDDCAPGLSCDRGSSTCQPRRVLGRSCVDQACDDGLYCAWQDNTCQLPAADGERCDDLPCADGLYCEWDPQSSEARCQRHAQAGESCAEVACLDALWCNEANVCVTAPSQGEPCLFSIVCATGLVCEESSDVCVTPPEAGAPCVQGECARGSFCDLPDNLCAPAQPNGEMCSGHRQCESNFCPNGFCWPRPGSGEACDTTSVCAPGLVCNGQTCELTDTRAPAACSYPGW